MDLCKPEHTLKFMHDLTSSTIHPRCWPDFNSAQLPQLSDFAAAKNITSVHLHGKRLANVPEELTSMVWLRELNLSWNLLKSLPAALSLLTQLRDLEL